MSEGFFHPFQFAVPGVTSDVLCAALVRVLPTTLLRLDIVESAEEARRLTRNESLPDGSECWHRFFTPADLQRVSEPTFSLGMVRHEFSRLVRAGATFPASAVLEGAGTGFAISADGHVITNYHLVVAEVAHHQRQGGVIGSEVPCSALRAQIAHRGADGGWEWRDAERLWLVSNPPNSRALFEVEPGVFQAREDTALLRVEPAAASHVQLSLRVPAAQESVWMAGFPLRSARAQGSLHSMGYADADGTLRVSAGRVTGTAGDSYFTTDLDGAMGSSGSPVFDAQGLVIGMFSRTIIKGAGNQLEYGQVERVHVTSRLVAEGLGLDQNRLPSRPAPRRGD